MQRKPITHNLKIGDPYFGQVRDGIKDFELRFDDRDYKVGDIVVLEECLHPSKMEFRITGESVNREIKHILRKYKGLQAGYIILGLVEVK